ncbi:MAG: RNA-binding protein [Hyphomicrobiales bacterium]
MQGKKSKALNAGAERKTGMHATERQRMCIVGRNVQPVEKLIRFVLSPDGDVVPDLKAKLPGRGVWVGTSKGLVQQATDRGAFAKAFGAKANADEGLVELIARLLRKDALSLLGLANRAGLVTTGFEKVSAQLAKNKVTAILAANDASADGRSKIAARAKNADCRPVVIESFTSGEISLAIGRSNVVHAALAPGGLTDRFTGTVHKLTEYLGSNGG